MYVNQKHFFFKYACAYSYMFKLCALLGKKTGNDIMTLLMDLELRG